MNFNAIKIYDELVTNDMLSEIIKYIDSKGFQYGWHSNKQITFSHWNLGFSETGTSSKNRVDITGELPGPVKVFWEQIQPVCLRDYPILLRAYCNAHTYGTEGYIHVDSSCQEDCTMIVYLNNIWNPDWAGETVLFEDDEIIKAVLPKANRIFIFPSALKHVARGVSRSCPEIRKVLVFKATKSQLNE